MGHTFTILEENKLESGALQFRLQGVDAEKGEMFDDYITVVEGAFFPRCLSEPSKS